MMELEIVSIQTAKLADKLGFDEPCEYSYEGESLHKTFRPKKNTDDWTETAAPKQAFLQKWLRENWETHVILIIADEHHNYDYEIYKNEMFYTFKTFGGLKNNSYKEALEKGLYEALEHILKQQ